MAKIAIMTWLFYENYGSVLQAYALGKYLSVQGHQVEYVNYKPLKGPGKPLIERIKRPGYLKKKSIEIMLNRFRPLNQDLVERRKEFGRFVSDYFILTEEVSTDSELARLENQFDFFICGSDQIWSPLVFDKKFYLSFIADTRKKIAYAPSIGSSVISDKNIKALMCQYISDFNYLSIREIQGKQLINELCSRDAEVVADPTLLLSSLEWNEIAQIPLCDEDYLLVYLLGNNIKYWTVIKKIAKILNLKIKVIPFNNADYYKKEDVLYNLSPEKFVGYIKKAKLVCTDSYHGTAFSLIFSVPFLTFERFENKDADEQNSRIYSLLTLSGNEERLYKKGKWKQLEGFIESHPKFDDLSNLISSSKMYLKNALSDAEKNRIVSPIFPCRTCSGCSICQLVCNNGCIAIRKNENGFYEAIIDEQFCIKCGKCAKVCGFNAKGKYLDFNDSVYAIRTQRKDVLMKSASGGIAYTIAQQMIQKDYAVYGVSYNYDTSEAEHIRVTQENIDQLNKLQGSKYLQSNTRHLIQDIENQTIDKAVVFGTPCQIASLHRYLEYIGNRANYILIDLTCHGVPSYNLWDNYLNYIKKKIGANEIKKVEFRYKKEKLKTNDNMVIYIAGDSDKIYINRQENDLFYHFFTVGNCYSNACYECNFRNKSFADIRIGDYWTKKYSRVQGTSMLCVLNSQGKDLLDLLDKKSLIVEQGSMKNYFEHQQIENSLKPIYYDELQTQLRMELPIKFLDKKYCKVYFKLKKIKYLRKLMGR